MNKQSLFFNDIEVNKKDFYASKKAIPLNLVDVNNILILTELKTIMILVNITILVNKN